MAESVRLLTKRGIIVENEANPRPNPKNPPSITFTMKLNGKFFLWTIDDVLRVATNRQSSSVVVYHNASGS
jgi:hypothetical protein